MVRLVHAVLNHCILTFTKAFTFQKGEKGLYQRCAVSSEEASFYNEVTGCKSRYDDFQVLHIKQTFFIHNNVRNQFPSIPFLHSASRLD